MRKGCCMKRKLFTFFSALSLLIFVGLCVLWVRSYGARETFSLWSSRFVLGLHSGGGRAALTLATGKFSLAPANARSDGLHYDRDRPTPVLASLGVFSVNNSEWTGTM